MVLTARFESQGFQKDEKIVMLESRLQSAAGTEEISRLKMMYEKKVGSFLKLPFSMFTMVQHTCAYKNGGGGMF